MLRQCCQILPLVFIIVTITLIPHEGSSQVAGLGVSMLRQPIDVAQLQESVKTEVSVKNAGKVFKLHEPARTFGNSLRLAKAFSGKERNEDAAAKIKRQSTIAGIVGMAGFVLLFIFSPIGVLGCIAGLVMGLVALGKHRKAKTTEGKTMAWLAVIFGGLGVLFALVAVAYYVTLFSWW